MYLLSYLVWSIPHFIVILPVVVLYHLIIYKKCIKNNRGSLKTLVPHIIAAYIFCFNLAVILTVTGIPSIFFIRVHIHANLIPFVDVSSNYVQYVQNIILFVPLGFMLPMLCKNFEEKRLTFFTGFLFSLAIEILQLFSPRTTDIDDLLMNTAGVVTGYFFFTGVKKIYPRISIFSGGEKREIYFYFIFALSTIFFISQIILDLLY